MQFRLPRSVAIAALAIMVAGPTVLLTAVLSFLIGPFCLIVPVLATRWTVRAVRKSRRRAAALGASY